MWRTNRSTPDASTTTMATTMMPTYTIMITATTTSPSNTITTPRTRTRPRHDHDGHEHPGLFARLRHLVAPHSHDSATTVDAEMETSREGIRTLWLSLAILGTTALIQALVVVLSGSVALLGDTLHNVADALTAVPLGLAFLVGRRSPTRRYTYGYGRAEDLAGIVIVGFIAVSAAAAGWASIDRLRHPADVSYLGVVAAAADHRLPRQRGGGAAAGTGGQADRVGGPGRRRAARPSRRLHLAGGSAQRGRPGARLALGRPAGRPRHHSGHPRRALAGGPGDLPATHGRGRSVHCGCCRVHAAKHRRRARRGVGYGCAGSATGSGPSATSWSTRT